MDEERLSDRMAEELAAYQEQLERSESAALSSPSMGDGQSLPIEMSQDLAAQKRCLDLLHLMRTPILRRGQPSCRPQRAVKAPTTGRFERLEELGCGGFGIVFRARDPVTGRIVALKIPRPEVLASVELRARFEQEAEAAARLDHPNIVPILEAGADGLVPYIASTYYEGPTLGQWLKEQGGAVPPRRAALLALSVAKALTHAHDRGVLHRDVKPSNVLLAPVDDAEQRELPFEPKLMDFGLAKLGERDQELTRTGAMLGTLKYMSPEQVAGHAKEITAATDVYGLGVVLYEVLTGAPPFGAESDWLTVRRVLEDEPRSVSSIRRDVPRDLAVIVQKCLSKLPAQRYRSARELAEDLERYLSGNAILARPVPSIERMAKWCRRNPAWATLLAVISLSVIAGGGFLSNSNTRILAALDAEHKLREELSVRLYAADMRRADEAIRENDITHAREILNRYVNSGGEGDPREFVWHFLSKRLPQHRAFTPPHPGPVYSINLSSDEKLLATACADGKVRIWDHNRLIEEMACDGAEPNEVAFSPDQRWMAAACDDGLIRVWRTADWNLHQKLPMGGVITTDIANLPDRSQAVAVQPNGAIIVAGARSWINNDQDVFVMRYKSNGVLDDSFGDGGKVFPWPGYGADEAYGVLVEPDGKIAVAGSHRQNDFIVARLNRDGSLDPDFGKAGRAIVDLGGHRDRAFAMVRQPDAKYLLCGQSWMRSKERFDVTIVRLLRNGELDATFGEGGIRKVSVGAKYEAFTALALQPDGKVVAVGYMNHDANEWNSIDSLIVRFNVDGSLDSKFGSDGIVVLPLSDANDQLNSVLVQPDGKILLAGAAGTESSRRCVAARLSQDGSLDSSFGINGIARPDFGAEISEIRSFSLLPDGGILIGGVIGAESEKTMLLARLDSEGSLDPSFGVEGRAPISAGNSSEIWGLSICPDGKIVCTGDAYCGDGTASRNVAVVRTFMSGTPDLTFCSNGAQGVCFTPDSSQIVGFAEQCIRFWDVATGEVIKEAYVPWGSIESIDIGEDGAQLAAVTRSNAWIWKTNELSTPIRRMNSGRELCSVALLPRAGHAAIGFVESQLEVFDLAANEHRHTLESDGAPRKRHVRASADGKWLTSVSANTATAYRCSDLSRVATIAGQSRLFAATMGAGAKSVLTSNATGEVLEWPIQGDQSSTLGLAARPLFIAPGQAVISCVAFSPDGERTACGQVDGQVTLLDTHSGAKIGTISDQQSPVIGLVFLDDHRLAICYAKGTIAVVRLDQLRSIEARDLGHPIQQFAATSDAKLFAVSFAGSQSVEVLCGVEFTTVSRIEYQGQGKALAFSEAHVIVAGGAHLEVFDAKTGHRVAGESQLGNSYEAIAVFPNHSCMAVAESLNGVTIRDCPSARTIGKLPGGMQRIIRIAVSPDGRNLATASHEGVVRIWDPKVCEPLLTLDDNPANELHFLKNRLFVIVHQSMMVWENEVGN